MENGLKRVQMLPRLDNSYDSGETDGSNSLAVMIPDYYRP